MPWWAVCCTVVATETSTLTFIGIPATAYAGNMTFLQLALGYVIGRILVSVLFIPAYFRGDLVTSYELLQRRFGRRVTTLSAGLFLVTRSLADGIRLFATSLVISVVTGVPTAWATLVVGAVMIVYTVRGGAAAVIWTDVVQMFVYVGRRAAGGLAAARAAFPGGWDEVVRAGIGGRQVHGAGTCRTDPVDDLHAVDRPLRRRRAHARHPRHRSVPGAAAAGGHQRPGRRDRPGAERRHRLRRSSRCSCSSA